MIIMLDKEKREKLNAYYRKYSKEHPEYRMRRNFRARMKKKVGVWKCPVCNLFTKTHGKINSCSQCHYQPNRAFHGNFTKVMMTVPEMIEINNNFRRVVLLKKDIETRKKKYEYVRHHGYSATHRITILDLKSFKSNSFSIVTRKSKEELLQMLKKVFQYEV